MSNKLLKNIIQRVCNWPNWIQQLNIIILLIVFWQFDMILYYFTLCKNK